MDRKSTMNDALNGYAAWVDASDPEQALRAWPRITLQANNTSGPHGGPQRRPRASAINALKRAIERLPLNDAHGQPYIKLVLESKSYSETWGFMHASYFTYRIERG